MRDGRTDDMKSSARSGMLQEDCLAVVSCIALLFPLVKTALYER
jgi:hypothetical protein